MQFARSLEYLNQAKDLIPVCSQTFSKSYTYFPVGASPLFLECGKGSHVWDVDGNEYIDYIMALGPITLGYCYPRVDDAIKKQLGKGVIFSQPHPLEIELARLLKQVIPCCEMARFLKTGSEATQAAVRVARAYTGRELIAHWGYHGWHSEFAIDTERTKGIPGVLRKSLLSFVYNDSDSLERLFLAFPEQIAAVIMEPVIATPPKPSFLQDVEKITHKYRALLIFDETVTGFRWSLGGAGAYFGVSPNLATFGKGMANGMPIAAVVGSREVMREFEDVFVSSTFGGECLSLAASIATIEEMREKATVACATGLGTILMARLSKVGLKAQGYPCRPFLQLEIDNPYNRSLLLQELFKRGVLLHSGLFFNLCYSHSNKDIKKTVRAFRESLQAIDDGVCLEGSVVQPAFKRV